MKLAGNWKGFYEYGQGAVLAQFGERVNIFVEIQDVEDGFEGECVEEKSAHSIDEISFIKGFLEFGMVSFVKTYPNFHLSDENGKIEVIKGKEMEVHYYGSYDENAACLYGTWEIESEEFEHLGKMVVAVYSGIWKLSKEK